MLRRIGKFLALAVAYGLGVLVLYKAFGAELPTAELWPLWLAPACVFGTATLTFFDTRYEVGENERRIRQFNKVSMIVVSFCCLLLSAPNGPINHLYVVAGLYIWYVIWDFKVKSWLLDGGSNGQQAGTEGKGVRLSAGEVEVASRLLNRPTLVGVLGVIFAIKLHETADMKHLLASCIEEVGGTVDPAWIPRLIRGEAEIFVAGVIGFHLMVSAMAFLLAPHLEDLVSRRPS